MKAALARPLAMAALAWLAGAAMAAELAAGVVFASGATSIVAADGVARQASRGGEIYAGETVETGGDGRAQLKFRDGASLSLQPASRFRIDEYRFSAGGGQADAEDKGFFSLLKGGLRTISGLIGKVRRDQYRVNTVVATIGIRGTEYSAQLGEGGLAVTTVSGLVEVCNPAGCVLVHPGQTAGATGPDRKPEIKGGEGVAVKPGEVLPGLPPTTGPAQEPPLPAGPKASPAAGEVNPTSPNRGATTFSVPPPR